MPHPLSSRRGGSHRQHPYQHHQQHHQQRQHPHSQNYQQQFNQQGQNYRNHSTAGNGTAMGPIQKYARAEYDYQHQHQHQQISPQRYYENNQFGQSSSMSTPVASRQPSSHQPDEEAAAKALLMSASAGGRGGSASERRVNETNEIKEERKCKDSTDAKVIVDNVAHVSPSSNDGLQLQLHSNSHADDCGDHDSIQDEMNGASMENFPMKLHSLLSSGNHSSVVRWMPDGKVWRIINWHELSNIMPKYFPKFCENRSGTVSVMNRMDLFLKEVEVWGFKKEKDLVGNMFFCHEFFMRVAPNLTKYLTPRKSIRSLQSVQNEILSPPRIGRLIKKHVNPRPLDSIFCGKRKEQESPVHVGDKDGIVIAAEGNNASDGKGVTSPVTPSFTLANQVSPNSEISPRGRLQSSRGRAKMVNNGDMKFMFPVSKRGRRSTNVSSRGGRGGGMQLKYDDQPSPSAIIMFPPRPKPN